MSFHLSNLGGRWLRDKIYVVTNLHVKVYVIGWKHSEDFGNKLDVEGLYLKCFSSVAKHYWMRIILQIANKTYLEIS